MKKYEKKLLKREDGNVIVLLAFGLSAMIAVLGLVIDGGYLYMSKSHLQKTANAAALSGAQEIPNEEADVHEVVNHILESHGEKTSLLNASIENNNQLQVELQKNVPIFFASLFGVDYVPIKVNAKAALKPMGQAKGAVPLGINESVTLNYGQEYQLKVGAGDSTTGNFGILALQGPGAKLYGETLKYGFDEPLKVGDILKTQTGNIAGETQKSIEYRMANCPSGDYHDRDCARVMLVIVYKPLSSSQLQVTGFAYFYVTEQVTSTDSTIKGIFIKRAGAGLPGAASQPDTGAYAITLTE